MAVKKKIKMFFVEFVGLQKGEENSRRIYVSRVSAEIQTDRELEVHQLGNFFKPFLRIPDVCNADVRLGPQTASDSRNVAYTVRVFAGAGLKLRVEAVQSVVGKKEGLQALFLMVLMLVKDLIELKLWKKGS
ncbi:uncharacterized protein MONOS_14671 [Monocercomonoides exilis]|uniref:uncharacterized protein n=1 Tax=Monocercomonoides exilis TaxID=2049356 RepID=UPI0035593AA4|nr:hypothetical protein MONOS_14671 [Monocercomonoides exilis]|eukprot:MONOS_14671.1-p1 / transcript=MONOS_14671.1 / gene=MONOS_14671 / organism=Monocercomonoides_exilis_PA203 / gene_product=unspecified product / transcript_product=unspecified product / location=Mono_scaffold01045:17142-17850(+) / protein_length=132 / sequence_SO=supercontig / SO=protein_coding / is_pseudo=false